MSAINVINAINAINAMCVCPSEPPFPGGTLSLGLLPARFLLIPPTMRRPMRRQRAGQCALSLSPCSHALYFFQEL